ncbi:unnamed protein product [Symbiodinium microadriaticum]|nr:unnamed protein product [Symbiodinium microadriaticum]
MEMFAEYKTWMENTFEKGIKITGQELKEEAVVVGNSGNIQSSTANKKTTGYFILEAETLEAAVQEKPAYVWLAGAWEGDGFGGQSEEIWSVPSADGKMMGAYRHHTGDGELNFYEFLVLDETGIQLKHFTPELISWEEKEDFVTFEMISYDEKTIEMKGLTFKLITPDQMEIYLKLKGNDGVVRTEVFHMTRRK